MAAGAGVVLAQNDKKLLYCPKLKVEKAGPKATKQEKAKLEKDFNTKCWNQAKVRLPYCAAHCRWPRVRRILPCHSITLPNRCRRLTARR